MSRPSYRQVIASALAAGIEPGIARAVASNARYAIQSMAARWYPALDISDCWVIAATAVWRCGRKFRGGKFIPYAMAAIRNELREEVRRTLWLRPLHKKHGGGWRAIGRRVGLTVRRGLPRARPEREEARSILRTAIYRGQAGLTREQSEALLLCCYHGLTLNEAAELCGTTGNAMRFRRAAALAKVRAMLGVEKPAKRFRVA